VTFLAGRSLLVVGGAGFVGSNLIRQALAGHAARVLVVDNLLSSERENVPVDERVELVEGSIADDDVLDRLDDEFDFVFHLATYHGNQSSIADPLADHEHNLITTLKLYERLQRFERVQKVVYAASGCTLAPHTWNDAEAVTEDGPVPLDLDSPYQISKVVGEFYSVYYHRQHGLPTVRARFQNVYGPGEVLGAGRWRGTPATVWRNVAPTFVYRALKGLPVELDNGGVASRDFVYVGDVARGLLACAERGAAGDVYNLASGEETTIRQLAERIIELAGSSSPLEVQPARAWDRSGRRFGSTAKAERELGFRTETGLDEGLTRTIAWTRERLDFIDACIAKHARELEHAGRPVPAGSIPSAAARD
jgi:nucleoside-diphosphate-sugar epimerase